MNKTVSYLFIALLFNSLTLSKELPSLSFNNHQTVTANARTDLKVENCSNMPINSDLSLPYRSYLLKIDDYFKPADFSYEIITSNRLENQAFELNYNDFPTTDQNGLYSDLKNSPELLNLGSAPVVIENIIEYNDQRYLSLLLFPISYSEETGWVFNQDFKLLLNNQVVTEAELLSFDVLTKKPKIESNNLSLSGSVEYLIVTSSNLSFEHLLNYKKSLGVSAVVKTIEEIEMEQTGYDSAEKLRNYLKQFYAEGGKYVLLGGDETILPIRYAFAGISYSPPEIGDLQICDLYFADLTGNWDVNGNGIFGERYLDSADYIPELLVGRLPLNNQTAVDNYTNKLIQYQTNQANHDNSYLERTFFLTADQMRDFGDNGQHNEVSQVFPINFAIDTSLGIEQTRGDDPTPTNLPANQLEAIISSGYGIINILNHGSYHGFTVRSSGYNEFPKSSFSTMPVGDVAGSFENFETNNNISFYYSLACDNGAFDKDGAPFNYEGANMVETLLGMAEAGAVGFVANSRWGWVNSSHFLMADFYKNVFQNPNLTAAEALSATKLKYAYLRDQVYGLNYFGDPMLKIHTANPRSLSTDIRLEMDQIQISSESDHNPISDCQVILSDSGNVIQSETTDEKGEVVFNLNLDFDKTYQISIVKEGYYTVTKEIIPSIATDVDDEMDNNLPQSFSLHQNYPNPFNPTTTIVFELPHQADVLLDIYSIESRKIISLAHRIYSAGTFSFEWDGRNASGEKVASGVYFYRLKAGDYSASKKMLLLK